MAEVSFDRITERLTELGIPAYIEQTGGGTATIQVGEVTDREEARFTWVNGKRRNLGTVKVPRYAVLVGPGYFAGPGWTDGRGDTSDLYVGPDDDGEGEFHTVPKDATEDDVIRAVVEQYRKP